MVYKTLGGRYIGVLNDFDLSSTQDNPSGLELTGTVPFMSIEFLTQEAIEGKVKHLYRHDAESFLWVLTWVSLRYKTGQLLSKPRPLDRWLTLDAIQCRVEKNDFLFCGRHEMKPSQSHKRSWKVVQLSLRTVLLFNVFRPRAVEPIDSQSEDSDDSELDDPDEFRSDGSDESGSDDSDESGSDGSEADSSKADGADVSVEAHRRAFASLKDATVFKMWLRNNIRTQLRAKYLDVRVGPTS
jgi:hypothetical protein